MRERRRRVTSISSDDKARGDTRAASKAPQKPGLGPRARHGKPSMPLPAARSAPLKFTNSSPEICSAPSTPNSPELRRTVRIAKSCPWFGRGNAAVRPVSHRQLSDYTMARQSKAQAKLRREVQLCDAELIRFILCRESEAEECANRTSFHQSPAVRWTVPSRDVPSHPLR